MKTPYCPEITASLFRAQRLYDAQGDRIPARNRQSHKPGTLQMRHEKSGLLLNVPCYHPE